MFAPCLGRTHVRCKLTLESTDLIDFFYRSSSCVEMARLVTLLFALVLISAASCRVRAEPVPMGPAAANGSTVLPVSSPVANDTEADAGNSTGVGPFTAILASAPFNTSLAGNASLMATIADRLVASGNIPIQSNSTLAHTLLWPTDQAWAEFFKGVGLAHGKSLSPAVLQNLTVGEAAAVQPVQTLFFLHSLPFGLTTANMTNISIAALPEGVLVNESQPFIDAENGSLLSKSGNAIVGLPTTQYFDGAPARLDVFHDLINTGRTIFKGHDNKTGANISDAATAASQVVQGLGPNKANVLFADVPGPNGFVIHVIDKVLLPSNQSLVYLFGPESDLVANLTAAAGIDGEVGAGSTAPTFADILVNTTARPKDHAGQSHVFVRGVLVASFMAVCWLSN